MKPLTIRPSDEEIRLADEINARRHSLRKQGLLELPEHPSVRAEREYRNELAAERRRRRRALSEMAEHEASLRQVREAAEDAGFQLDESGLTT